MKNKKITVINKQLKTINPNQKTILFVQPYGSVLSLLQQGVSNNYNLIILTAQVDLRVVPVFIIEMVDLAIQVDTADNVAVLELVNILSKEMHIDAVIPGFEYFVPLVAQINDYLQLPGMDISQAMQVRRKDLMRQVLCAADIATPKFHLVTSFADLDQAITKIGFPAVCKPVDAAGSVNVMRVTNKDEATIAATHILCGDYKLWGHQLQRKLLFEEYIEGKEFSLEGIVCHSKTIHFSMTEKFVSDQNEFVEIGHIVNVPMDVQLKSKIEGYVEQVIRVLGVNSCPFHAEIRLSTQGEPVLMEIAARLAGDKMGDLINLSRGVNYYDYVYAAYLREVVHTPLMSDAHAGIRFFYRPTTDSYSTINGLETMKQYPVEEAIFYYPPEKPIPGFPKPLRRLGHVIMKSDHYLDLVSMLGEIDQHVVFS